MDMGPIARVYSRKHWASLAARRASSHKPKPQAALCPRAAGPLYSALILVVLFSMVLSGLVPASADTKQKHNGQTEELSGDKQIIHLLNRIGYGPRPGDIQRVREMGISQYIDQQLHPDRIDDHSVETELAQLRSLRMSISEAYSKYPAPNQIAMQLGLRGLNAQAGAAGKAGDNQAGIIGPESSGQDRPGQDRPGPGNAAEAKDKQQQQRDEIRDYYVQHGLRLPQRLLMELQAQKLVRAVDSPRQLQEVMTDFWFNHFNVFWDKGFDRWMTTDFEMNAIRPHTLGKFRDLLMATAKSPAMMFYLDNFLSSTPNPRPARLGPYGGAFPRVGGPPFFPARPAQGAGQQRRKPGINENYARELMELHTLGVDGGYTQKDVQEVARCFTGWTIDRPRVAAKFIFRPNIHDDGEKFVLGNKIPAGGGERDGEMVIDILARHPSTAKFISTAMVRRFVSDNPPQSLVSKITEIYVHTGGDIREM
ncbi:MAG TPA: DUF1800 domain-containing protein, partial [Blastocatellia bacterium]|nr:DUF1800 domain-containing protein [Blastocatellia bacterium]